MQDKKTEILNKALELFKEKGYDNVTVNEIASASNISKNTFYYYYESKEVNFKIKTSRMCYFL